MRQEKKRWGRSATLSYAHDRDSDYDLAGVFWWCWDAARAAGLPGWGCPVLPALAVGVQGPQMSHAKQLHHT